MRFVLLAARWTKEVNELHVRCRACGNHFWVRADRNRIRCRCSNHGHITDLRRQRLP